MWAQIPFETGSILRQLSYWVFVLIFSNVLWVLWRACRKSFTIWTRELPSFLIVIAANAWKIMAIHPRKI